MTEDIDKIIEKQFDDIVNLSKTDTRIKHWYDTGVYSMNYTLSKNLKGGIPVGRIVNFHGESACLAGDTKLKVHRGKGDEFYTIKDLYESIKGIKRGNKWDNSLQTEILSMKEDYLFLNEIDDVYESGVKECFRVTTKNGNSIVASAEHPFKVKDELIKGRGNPLKDNFVPIKNLRIGDLVYVRAKDGTKPKDENPINDLIENLEVMDGKDHSRYHSKKHNFRHFEVELDEIISIESVGEIQTYDISMKGPFKNFVADNFVVHNTGKSLITSSIMKDPSIDIVFVIETEGGGSSRELYEFLGVPVEKIRVLKANTFENYKMKKSDSSVEEISDDKFPKKRDDDKYVYVEGVTRLTKKIINAFQFNDKLRDKKVLIVLDSLGNVTDTRSLNGISSMGYRGQKINQFFQTFDNAFEKSNITFLFTNKVYTNLGNQYVPFVETGGVNVVFNPSISVELKRTASSEDVSDGEKSTEKDRKNSALGSSISPIRIRVKKSRFGTDERRNTFLISSVSGPVRLSGLFELLKDFDVIKSPSSGWYEIPELWENKFRKKDFISLVQENEAEYINKLQELLDKAEERIKKESLMFQANDIDEVEDVIEKVEKEYEEEYYHEDDSASLVKQLENEGE